MARNIYNSNHMVTKQWKNKTPHHIIAGKIVVVGDDFATVHDDRSATAILAVALVDIPKTTVGSVGFNCGVNTNTSGNALTEGEVLVWDASSKTFNNDEFVTGAGDITGSCYADETTEETTTDSEKQARIWLTGIPGVRTVTDPP